MARTYPIELRLTDRPVVVVGGGEVAARKVAGLIEARALIRVVSPVLNPYLLERKDITRECRPYAVDCLVGARLVFACTDDRAVNAQVAADAQQLGVWCSVADEPEEGDFHVPATLRRGELTVSVSTGGASPGLAAALRDRLDSHFGPEWSILIEELARARDELKNRVTDPDVRRQILETLCADCSLNLLATRDREAWRAWFERVTEYRLTRRPVAQDGM